MTRKEIKNFLDNTKVYVNGKSKEIQKKLFSLGYTWSNEENNVKHTDKPFLFIYENNEITFTYDMEWFANHENREITAEQILSLGLTKLYRPFKNQEECWNEMLKHQPFGFIVNKYNNDYCGICRVFKDEKGISRITFISNPYSDLDMEIVFDRFNFADGTPFGIKEE